MLRLATALAVTVAALGAMPAAADDLGGGQMVVAAQTHAAIGLGIGDDGRIEQAGTTIPFEITRTHEGGRLVITIVPRD